MSTTLNKNNRNVIPIWRSFNKTVDANELDLPNKIMKPKSLVIDIEGLITDFKSSPNLYTATDLYSGIITNGITDEGLIEDVKNYILEHPAGTQAQRLFLTGKYEDRLRSLIDIHTTSELFTLLDIRSSIHNLKKVIYNNPLDATLYVDLSRLYTIIGQSKQAEKYMSYALKISRDNRFVVRSAVRLFSHIGELDKGQYYLKKSGLLSRDPWVYAAYVGLNSLMGKVNINKKLVGSLTSSGRFSDFDLTELVSALATIEINEGNYKTGRKLFRKSLIEPNSNTLAQVEWFSNKFSVFPVEPTNYDVPNKFEAIAYDSYSKKRFEDAYQNAVYWYLDVPYSTEPILNASHIACIFLQNFEKAEDLLTIGLTHNPYNALIINNLAYCKLKLNKTNEAVKLLSKLINIDMNTVLPETRVCIWATIGLYFISINQQEEGITYYDKGIESANKLKDKSLSILTELFLADALSENHPRTLLIKNKFKELDKGDWVYEIEELWQRVKSK